MTVRLHKRKFPVRPADYASVTETPSIRLTREALAMQASRYAFAATMCPGKDVLEVACGAGSGLGNFGRANAGRVIGGDYTESLVVQAARYYRGRFNVLRLDAQALPFRSETFDLIVLFEAIYYLREPSAFYSEASRVLRPHGQVVTSMINAEWRDHNPSPLSTHYPSAKELGRSLSEHGFESRLYGGFRIGAEGGKRRLVSAMKRTAISFGLMPKTMKGKEWLKRIFLGALEHAPCELKGAEQAYDSPHQLYDLAESSRFKVIYAVAQKGGGKA